MDLEFVGIVNHRDSKVGTPPTGPDFDPDHIRTSALAQESAGYNRVLIANSAVMPESFCTGSFLSAATSKLGFMMAHRPGVAPPTLMARHLGTVDRLSKGRAAVHIIAGADDREVQADGLFNTKEERYRIAAEYVQVMRKMWSSPEPFDHKGEYYTFNGAFAMTRPETGAVPVYWAGTSDLALDIAGQVADVYALAGDTYEAVGALAKKALTSAERHERDLKILMTTVVILGDTEEAAWDRAHKLYDRVIAQGTPGLMAKHEKEGDKPAAKQWQTLYERAQEGDVLDDCLWMGLNKAFKGRGNNSCLVGTPEQVANALMKYRRLGITRYLLRSPDHGRDTQIIGRDLLPLVREKAAAMEASL